MSATDKSLLQELLFSKKELGKLRGVLKLNEPLAKYTTWKIGGNAECFYQPKDSDDIVKILQLIPDSTPVYWIGLGSNLLIRDAGVNGLIIYSNGVLNELDIQCPEGQDKNKEICLITSQVGVACAIFSRKVANYGINGAEFLSGIPGTIGGALAMNAGAFGGETWRYVRQVETINQYGQRFLRTPDDYLISYRSIRLKDTITKENREKGNAQEWFLSATFGFEKDEKGLQKSKAKIKRLLNKRAQSQPTKQANAGSVFKNPENDYAARLIESCGLKGKTINGAQISEKHANFIVNIGNAKSQDVEKLIAEIKNKIWLKYAIKLETEIRIIGQQV